LQQLANNLTDLAVMVRPPEALDTRIKVFAPHPYVIVAPPDHPLAHRRRIAVAALAQSRFSCASVDPIPGTACARPSVTNSAGCVSPWRSRAPKPSSRRSSPA
jgi:DNA-binding transcriptional LysR family regulator